MPLYRRGRGDIEIERFLENTQAVLSQIATFSQQWESQNTNLDHLENAVDRMTDICTRFGVLYQSVPRFEIMKDQLEFLRSKHFRRASIAKLHCTSLESGSLM